VTALHGAWRRHPRRPILTVEEAQWWRACALGTALLEVAVGIAWQPSEYAYRWVMIGGAIWVGSSVVLNLLTIIPDWRRRDSR
jgi:hypothetical protein